MNPTNLWSFFKKFRLVIFALSAILSLAWTVFLSIFLSHEWPEYQTPQRGVFISLVAIHGISTILLYLMIVVQFRMWLDAARIAFLLLFHLGTTGVFSLVSVNYPCTKFGSFSSCKTTVLIIIIGCWAQSGLLLIYAMGLAMISCIPRPNTSKTRESFTRAQRSSQSHHQGRLSVSSVDSGTWLLRPSLPRRPGRPSAYAEALRPNSLAPSRSLSPIVAQRGTPLVLSQYKAQRSTHLRSYRPRTPSSIYFTWNNGSLSSTTMTRNLEPIYPNNEGHHSPYPSLPSSPANSTGPFPPRPLLSPFAGPVARSVSPMSISSLGSSNSESSGYFYGERKAVFPSEQSLSLGAKHTLPPPYPREMTPSQESVYSGVGVDPYRSGDTSPTSPNHLQVPGTPVTVRSPVRANIPLRAHAATPGAHSIHSMAASLHIPNLAENVSAPALPLRTPSAPPPLPPPPSAMLSPLPSFQYYDSRPPLQYYGSSAGGTSGYRGWNVGQPAAGGNIGAAQPVAMSDRTGKAVYSPMYIGRWQQDVLRAAGVRHPAG